MLPQIRIVKIKLKKELTETVLQMSNENTPLKELKQLCWDRWKIKISHDRLKNKLHIEKFTRKKENNH